MSHQVSFLTNSFFQDYTWMGRSVRNIPLGTFDGNVAKSNAHTGFHFTHHESGEEIILSNSKSIKNKYTGLYFFSSRNVTITNRCFCLFLYY